MSSQQNWPPAPGADAGPRRHTDEHSPAGSVFDALANATRRRIVGSLLRNDDAEGTESEVRATALAADVAAAESLSPDDPEEVRLELRHAHLPKLAAASLVRWDRERDVVALAEHPAFDDETLRRVVTAGNDVDDVLAALADDRRRLVLAVLHAYGGAVERETVLEKVGDLEDDFGDATADDRERRVSLAHVHLPRLEDADLVARDEERGTLRYLGHPDVEESWFTF